MKRLLFKNPSAVIGLIGALLAIAAKLVPAVANLAPDIQRALDSIAVLLVPLTAGAIGAVAYAPATVAKATTEAGLKVAQELTTETVGVVGDVTTSAVSTAVDVTKSVLGDTAEVAEAATGEVRRVLGKVLPG